MKQSSFLIENEQDFYDSLEKAKKEIRGGDICLRYMYRSL